MAGRDFLSLLCFSFSFSFLLLYLHSTRIRQRDGRLTQKIAHEHAQPAAAKPTSQLQLWKRVNNTVTADTVAIAVAVGATVVATATDEDIIVPYPTKQHNDIVVIHMVQEGFSSTLSAFPFSTLLFPHSSLQSSKFKVQTKRTRNQLQATIPKYILFPSKSRRLKSLSGSVDSGTSVFFFFFFFFFSPLGPFFGPFCFSIPSPILKSLVFGLRSLPIVGRGSLWKRERKMGRKPPGVGFGCGWERVLVLLVGEGSERRGERGGPGGFEREGEELGRKREEEDEESRIQHVLCVIIVCSNTT